MQRSLIRLVLPLRSASSSFTGRPFLTLSRSLCTNPSPGKAASSVSVNDLCIPLSPPYSIASILSSATSASPNLLSEQTLRKLHKLSALPYPSCTAEEMSSLIGVIEGIKSTEVRGMLQRLELAEKEEGKEQEIGWGRRVVKINGSGEKEGAEVGMGLGGKAEEANGRELLKLAERTKGDFYVVQKPKRGSE